MYGKKLLVSGSANLGITWLEHHHTFLQRQLDRWLTACQGISITQRRAQANKFPSKRSLHAHPHITHIQDGRAWISRLCGIQIGVGGEESPGHASEAAKDPKRVQLAPCAIHTRRRRWQVASFFARPPRRVVPGRCDMEEDRE
eukprot:362506-Chlamydomonas_euryale.AAC.4